MLDIALPVVASILERDPGILAGQITMAEILEMLREKRAQLWVAVDTETDQVLAALVTEVIVEGMHCYVNAVAMAGEDLPSFLGEMFSVISRWARAINADGLRVEGRLGWERALREYGFRIQSVTLFKPFREVH